MTQPPEGLGRPGSGPSFGAPEGQPTYGSYTPSPIGQPGGTQPDSTPYGSAPAYGSAPYGSDPAAPSYGSAPTASSYGFTPSHGSTPATTPAAPTYGRAPAYGNAPAPGTTPDYGPQGPYGPPSAQAYPPPQLSDDAYTQPTVPRRENVGRGLLLALVAIVVGAGVSAALYQAGFILSIIAYGMAWGGTYLYRWGAGTPARKGAVPLVVLLVAGLIGAWLFTVGFSLYGRTGSLGTTVSIMLDTDFMASVLPNGAMFLLFGGLGIFGTVRQILGSRGPRG